MFTNITSIITAFMSFIFILTICVGCDNASKNTQDISIKTNDVSSSSVGTNSVSQAGCVVLPQPATNKAVSAATWHWRYDNGVVTFKCNKHFDANKLLDYITIKPRPASISVVIDGNKWWHQHYGYECKISADFSFDRSYTLKIHKEAPFTDGTYLEKEIESKFKLNDLPRQVAFASSGRYLPSSGLKAIAVNTVNVTNLLCRILPVPSHNIIQLLARENGRYYRNKHAEWEGWKDRIYWSADSAATENIAVESKPFDVPVQVLLNKKVSTPIQIRSENEGVVSNGVYLVAVREKLKQEDNRNLIHRLVCVTDTALTVRKDGKGNLVVWATSLTKGTPIAGLNVHLYEANNIMILSGETDKDGLVRFEVPHGKDAFAIVAKSKDGGDTSFIALEENYDDNRSSMRSDYLKKGECTAFAWTERGIYRHGEPIMFHFILRNDECKAPKPFPVEILLVDPDNKPYLKTTLMPDEFGAGCYCGFSVPDDQKSGLWSLRVKIPGKDGLILGSESVKIEEFVPPQIRVAANIATNVSISNLSFTVSAEHLYGGPAKGLKAEGLMIMRDKPFTPKGWDGYVFGDYTRDMSYFYKFFNKKNLDENGKVTFSLNEAYNAKKPAAAISVSVQGTVLEFGGRPMSSDNKYATIHFYPYYVGVKFPAKITKGASCDVALVLPDGKALQGEEREFKVNVKKLDYVYGYKWNNNGDYVWESDIVRFPVSTTIQSVKVGKDGKAKLELHTLESGEFELSIYDPKSNISFCQKYTVSDGEGDNSVHTSLSNPAKITVTCDKKSYVPGDKPRLAVKSAFPGTMLLSVYRDKLLYTKVFALTNCTSEIELDAVTEKYVPNVDVVLNLVQAAKPNQKYLVNRAKGVAAIKVARPESYLDVYVKADVKCTERGGADLRATVVTEGENDTYAKRAVVTVVDEAINLLTWQKTPNPYGFFGKPCNSVHILYDIYDALLPILDENKLKRSGFKTGGGIAANLLRRLNPIPSRRFKPLSMWQRDVELTNGIAVVDFKLPEFVGEVRVTAVAYNEEATGAASAQVKVTPRLVMQGDAPRFVAPRDRFTATLALSNRSGKEGVLKYEVSATNGLSVVGKFEGELKLAVDDSKILEIPICVGDEIREGHIIFKSTGFGETHDVTINMPIRPAVAWEQSAGSVILNPGEIKEFKSSNVYMPDVMRRSFVSSESLLSELVQAVRYLLDYPYGCLEQVTSQVFPLVHAGGILNKLSVEQNNDAKLADDFVKVGIQKILSMVRANDFAMWADVNYAPWDRNVSLWAAHFLVEANKAGHEIHEAPFNNVKGFLREWAMSTNSAVSVYACHTLALAGTKDLDRQLHWYDKREKLNSTEKFQLARAFIATGDRERAKKLLTEAVVPEDIRGKAFAVLALLDYDVNDTRLSTIVKQIVDMRDAKIGHWVTTHENAHALLAMGAFYRYQVKDGNPSKPSLVVIKDGKTDSLVLNKTKMIAGGGDVKVVNNGTVPGFLSFSQMSLPDPRNVVAGTNGIAITRTYRNIAGQQVDMNDIVRGDFLVVELKITTPEARCYSDLVIEELLPACFEVERSKNTTRRNRFELRRDERDDRVLIFTLPFALPRRDYVRYHGGNIKVSEETFSYVVRVVSKGEFILPGASVEAMYEPEIRATTSPTTIKIAK